VELEIHTSSEEVILHRDNIVTEGATSNVFMIKGDTLHTHPADSYILSGITRDLALEIEVAPSVTILSRCKITSSTWASLAFCAYIVFAKSEVDLISHLDQRISETATLLQKIKPLFQLWIEVFYLVMASTKSFQFIKASYFAWMHTYNAYKKVWMRFRYPTPIQAKNGWKPLSGS
jgi:hypothetical protein